MPEILMGRIVKGVGGLYDIALDSGDTVSCRAKGSFRHDDVKPYVGDIVSVGYDDAGNPVIAEIKERKNSLIRPPLANLDVIFVVLSAKNPTADLLTADKLIAIAEHNGIEPIIVISKGDLDTDNAEKIRKTYEKCGFTVFESAMCDENSVKCDRIYDFIKENLSDKISAFAGASGAGKSTLMNSLFPSLGIATGEVSQKIGRGRHTTRHVELFPMSTLVGTGSGFFADTPGFTMLDFVRFDFFDKEDLPATFREFSEHIGKCKYTKCTHTREEGCSVLEAVKNKSIPKSRHESYIDLFNVLKEKHKWDKKQ
ncbi:MAG: ribosome small subunit-dependent GTPase A [Clostridia bacterium]|nr:ribosome small subunit-dependent GTPase A [Clostridia bacterium]MBR3716034.1 ribosome small subunit-dependent GTPase A [Clostridia bacterium]